MSFRFSDILCSWAVLSNYLKVFVKSTQNFFCLLPEKNGQGPPNIKLVLQSTIAAMQQTFTKVSLNTISVSRRL